MTEDSSPRISRPRCSSVTKRRQTELPHCWHWSIGIRSPRLTVVHHVPKGVDPVKLYAEVRPLNGIDLANQANTIQLIETIDQQQSGIPHPGTEDLRRHGPPAGVGRGHPHKDQLPWGQPRKCQRRAQCLRHMLPRKAIGARRDPTGLPSIYRRRRPRDPQLARGLRSPPRRWVRRSGA